MKGHFFKPTGFYPVFLITIDLVEIDLRTKVTIYMMGSIDNEESVKNGDEITFEDWEFDGDKIVSIDVFGKYYFPTFTSEQQQWYHEPEGGAGNYLTALSEVMQFAINIGLEKACIKPY